MSYPNLLSPENDSLSTKQIQVGGNGSTHVVNVNFTLRCDTVQVGRTWYRRVGGRRVSYSTLKMEVGGYPKTLI